MQISKIRPQEVVLLDTDLLDEMCVRLGYSKAETAISAAMEDLAVLLQYTGTLLKAGDFDTLAVTARQIEGLAIRTGMAALSRVANDVRNLSTGDNFNALSATSARLRRVGEQSLIAIWDREDHTI